MSARPDCVQANVSLAPFTSWLVGGVADLLALPKTVDEARACILWAQAEGLTVSILGGGTNVLVSDRGVPGLTLGLKNLVGVESSGRDENGVFRMTVLAGTSKSELLKAFLKQKLAPALFLAGLPGDVGGGVTMNAGVSEALQPREFGEIVEWIEVMRFDGSASVERLAVDELQWSYRHCEGWGPGAIVRAGIIWRGEPEPDVLDRVRAANRNRMAKQPLDQPSCGSVFVNPPGHKAGQLVEACGLKGFAIGGARVSPKHANFIVNAGGASAADIDAVIRHVQQTVRDLKGVELKTEVVRLGRF